MAALTRKESEERQAAVLRYFVENPRATGEEAQRQLVNGRLTGKKNGPPMGQGMLYKLQRQAQDLLAKGMAAPASTSIRGYSLVLDEESMQAIRNRAKELQKLLEEGGPVQEIHISKDGVRVVRATVTEDKF